LDKKHFLVVKIVIEFEIHELKACPLIRICKLDLIVFGVNILPLVYSYILLLSALNYYHLLSYY